MYGNSKQKYFGSFRKSDRVHPRKLSKPDRAFSPSSSKLSRPVCKKVTRRAHQLRVKYKVAYGEAQWVIDLFLSSIISSNLPHPFHRPTPIESPLLHPSPSIIINIAPPTSEKPLQHRPHIHMHRLCIRVSLQPFFSQFPPNTTLLHPSKGNPEI